MSLPIALQREYDRWYPLIDHPTQLALVHDKIRFKIVPAGRRSGKTERAKRFVAKEAMRNANEIYFIAAPTRDQVKKIYWSDMKKLCFTSMCFKKPSETELTIFFNNGTRIVLIGLDKPERIEGSYWTGGVIDEIADTKKSAWAEHIRPALDTFNPLRPDYKIWCWLIGVPDGFNHYYDLNEYALNADDPEWKSYRWDSADILPPETIAAAKRQLSKRQFNQEYRASFESAQGRIYPDYSKKNLTHETIEPHEHLMWHHDFNYTPMSSGIAVERADGIYILDEIILTSAIAQQSALEFVDKFQHHENKKVSIYGDPAGRAGEKHGHASDYTDIENVLRSNGWDFTRKVHKAAPAIKDRQNAVRAKILSADDRVSLYVNSVKAPYAQKGLATVEVKEGSTFLEDDSEYQHITTAIGYMIDYEYPIVQPLFSTKIGMAT